MTAAQRLPRLARLRRVRDQIDRQYRQPLDLESLAREMGMSADELSREFLVAYGESPQSHVMTRRIASAVALLRRGDLSLTDVCSAVGCSSLSAFSACFSEVVGVPPGSYRSYLRRAGKGTPAGDVAQVPGPVRIREAAVPASV